MSVTIKLDAPAIRALIADDDKFRLELQTAVAAELLRNTVIPSIAAEFSKMAAGLVAEVVTTIKEDKAVQLGVANELRGLLSGNVFTPSPLTDKAKARVAEAVDAYIKALAGAQLPKLHQAQTDIIEQLKLHVDQTMPSAVRQAIEQYDRTQISAEVERKLNAIRAAI